MWIQQLDRWRDGSAFRSGDASDGRYCRSDSVRDDWLLWLGGRDTRRSSGVFNVSVSPSTERVCTHNALRNGNAAFITQPMHLQTIHASSLRQQAGRTCSEPIGLTGRGASSRTIGFAKPAFVVSSIDAIAARIDASSIIGAIQGDGPTRVLRLILLDDRQVGL